MVFSMFSSHNSGGEKNKFHNKCGKIWAIMEESVRLKPWERPQFRVLNTTLEINYLSGDA